jgi:hypothetical protein
MSRIIPVDGLYRIRNVATGTYLRLAGDNSRINALPLNVQDNNQLVRSHLNVQ